jgi:hypothetical protein
MPSGMHTVRRDSRCAAISFLLIAFESNSRVSSSLLRLILNCSCHQCLRRSLPRSLLHAAQPANQESSCEDRWQVRQYRYCLASQLRRLYWSQPLNGRSWSWQSSHSWHSAYASSLGMSARQESWSREATYQKRSRSVADASLPRQRRRWRGKALQARCRAGPCAAKYAHP